MERIKAGNHSENGPKTILVVDDSVELLTAVQVSLEPKYQVIPASNPFAGVRLAASHEPDAIVMDLDMPGMDGVEATRLLKRVDQTRGIPVIAFSSHALPNRRLEGRGFARIVSKDSGLEHLETELEDLLRPAM